MNTMLIQPLLEKASTWVVEVTDLQCNLGDELAFPEKEWLFSIVRRGTIGQVSESHIKVENLVDYLRRMQESGPDKLPDDVVTDADISGFAYKLDANYVQNYQADPTYQFNGTDQWARGDQGPLDGNGAYSLQPYKYTSAAAANNDIVGGGGFTVTHFHSGRYYSLLDLVHDIAMKLRRFTAEHIVVAGEDWVDEYDRETLEAGEFIDFVCDPGGSVGFRLTSEFVEDHFIVCSPLFQKVFKLSPLVGFYLGVTSIETITELDEVDLEVGPNVAFKIILNEAGVAPGDQIEVSSQNFNLYRGIDPRKKLILEASLPMPHTLAWDGVREATRYVLQEFPIKRGMISTKVQLDGFSYNNMKLQLREDQQRGSVVYLSGKSSMALKKLMEGQLQAFRLTLLIELDVWDSGKNDWTRIRRPVNMAEGDFWYLKLLFTKETV